MLFVHGVSQVTRGLLTVDNGGVRKLEVSPVWRSLGRAAYLSPPTPPLLPTCLLAGDKALSCRPSLAGPLLL